MKLTSILIAIFFFFVPVTIARAEAFVFGPVVDVGFGGIGPEVSRDGLSLYYEKESTHRTWLATRSSLDEPWSGHTQIASFTTCCPSISDDELTLYYNSNKSGYGDWDLFKMTRTDKMASWDSPVNLGSLFNTSDIEGGAEISADGLTLYYERGPRGYAPDIWYSQRQYTGSAWSTPQPLAGISTSASEGHPSISGDGLILVFNSNRLGGYGGSDIWYAMRPSINDAWGEPVNAGPNVNTAGTELQAELSSLDAKLYFCRTVNDERRIFYSEIIPEPSLVFVSIFILGLLKKRLTEINT